ncbi:cytochrome P450 [Apiospora marii]|uniref:Cytochrome P450 n=1 Tax=Apiospora marii TaxID=335849 RepID=A0ABR1RIK5_9PEZI
MDIFNIASPVASWAACGLVVYFLLFVIYRFFLHPLSKYPGPAVAKLSDVYAGFYTLFGCLHLRTYLDLLEYGPVLRAGPNKLVFKSAEALQDIYNNERVTKSHVYQLALIAGKINLFNVIDKRHHREKRRLIGHAINDKAIRAFEPTLIDQIDEFIRQLLLASRQPVSPVDMSKRSKLLGTDIVGHLAFGYPLNMQTEEENRFLIDGMKLGAYQYNAFMQWPLLKRTGIHRPFVFLGRKQRGLYLQKIQTMIRERLAQGKHAKQDLFSFTADYLANPGNGIDTSQLFSEALFFFPAAGDTTSTAISALFFYLSRSPEVYKKLAKEIRSTFQSNADIRNGPQLAGCRYLRACIDEALRMSPPVAGTLWREPYAEELGKGPFVVDGQLIPPGTQVGVSVYAIHHNEQYFSDPFVFRPERWLESDAETLSRMNSAFCPFSLGSRGCAGKSMAYLETGLVLAKTLWFFDFEVAPGGSGKLGEGTGAGQTDGRGRVDEFQTWDSFGSTHLGPNLVFHPRGELWREIETKA